jgi:hypothetical protein
MSDPNELRTLSDLYEKLLKLEPKETAEFSHEEIALLKEVAKNWPSINNLLKEHEAWRGFFRIGKYIFWFIIGASMLFTYYRDIILGSFRQ